MIIFKEQEVTDEKMDRDKINNPDFKFYTVVNTLSAVEHTKKSSWDRFFGSFKDIFYKLNK